jgi:tetratricopeptide (TPR) repeat protein
VGDLLGRHNRAEAAGETEEARRLLRELRRARTERNIGSLDVAGLALVSQGQARLAGGDRDGAEEDFRAAVDLAPHLPDAHFALARALWAAGPLRLVPAMKAGLAGLEARLPTVYGQARWRNLVTVGLLLVAFAVCLAFSAALLTREQGLVRHDLEEWLGPAQSRTASLGMLLLLLLLPIVTFQGWGWLPLWWLALLFTYLSRTERAVTIGLLFLLVASGPLVERMESRLVQMGNPDFQAAVAAVEGAGDPLASARLDAGRRGDPEDRDLAYLLAVNERRGGRYAEAAALYRELLGSDATDARARNNLANIEFAHRNFPVAQGHYRTGAQAGGPAHVQATLLYNLSLAHLQKFEYKPAGEARAGADRLARELLASYDRSFRFDSGDYAVVDLGLSREDVMRKYAGATEGAAARNVAREGAPAAALPPLRSLLNRFTGFVVVFALVALLFGRWRGLRAFTAHCLRCGTAFCRHCQLGATESGLCSQCYHLFVVRDGVSAPARNRKLGEVGRHEARRAQVFRILSLLAPGAGHVYLRWTLTGVVILTLVFALLAAILLPDWTLPHTQAPSGLLPLWPRLAAVLLLLVVWVLANRLRPTPGAPLPVRRPAPRRARAA